MSGRCDEQDDLALVYMWARKDLLDEIERLREALKYLLSEVERSSADVDPCAVRDSRTALRQAVDFEDRWDNA